MLRNTQYCKYLLKNINSQKRQLHLQHELYNKNTASIGRVMGKLFGNRLAGSKKRWFPVDSSGATAGAVVFKPPKRGGGKNATRRMTVLNKLFMEHITDLMATGEISETLLGKGLQVSRVKISQDFTYINVFWLSSGDVGKSTLLEHELQRCSGLLRHELSQLGLMGVVPRIKFVKDKMFTNIGQVEALLRDMDFGAEDDNEEELEDYAKHVNDVVKHEFFGNKVEAVNNKEYSKEPEPTIDLKLPEMRYDVLGLDHKGIMLKILTKMRKSKQAWEQHQQQSINEKQFENSKHELSKISELSKINDKLAKAAENSEKFQAFLAQRRERKNTPERKKFRVTDHLIDQEHAEQEHDVIMSARQRQLYEANDYLHEEEDKKS